MLAEYLGTKFVIPNPDTPTKPDTGRFQILYDYSDALEDRNQRLGSRKIRPHGSLLVSRADSSFVDKDWLLQADLLCTIVHLTLPSQYYWWPHTLLFDYRIRIRSDVFQKSESRQFYDKNLRSILGGNDLAGFKRRMEEEFGVNGRGAKYIVDGMRPDWEAMLNWDRLGTEP